MADASDRQAGVEIRAHDGTFLLDPVVEWMGVACPCEAGVGDHSGRSDEDRRQHLEFVQTAVGRMFAASSLAKGCASLQPTAALGFASLRTLGRLRPGGFAVLLFGFLDARYLREERRFRFYENARRGQVETYDARTGPYTRKDPHYDSSCEWRSVLRSWSLWGFYGPILIAAAAVIVRTCVR